MTDRRCGTCNHYKDNGLPSRQSFEVYGECVATVPKVASKRFVMRWNVFQDTDCPCYEPKEASDETANHG